jgi:hypothetical protein
MAKQKRHAKKKYSMLTCAWCKARILEDHEVFAVSTKKHPGIDLSDHEGKFIPLHLALAKKWAEGFVTPKDSPAKQAGYDVVFTACSENCGSALKTALQNEKDAASFMSLN